MFQIIPAILATTEKDYKESLSRIEQTGLFEWVHIDLMDNLFVPNGSIKPSLIARNSTSLLKEAHLMVAHPLAWVNELVDAGFKKIIFHIESQDNVIEVINQIKDKGLEVGLAIKNETPLENLEPFLDKVDMILVMGVVPGFQGQKFIPASLEKIKQLKSRQQAFKIGMDGAVKDDNIKEIVEAGADFVAVGSYLLKGNLDENLENLWEALKK